MHQNFLKLFVKNKVSLTVSKLQLNCMLPQGGESSLNLTAGLRRTIGKYMPFCKLIVNLLTNLLSDLLTYLDSKIPSREKSSLVQSTSMLVVTLRLLITE